MRFIRSVSTGCINLPRGRFDKCRAKAAQSALISYRVPAWTLLAATLDGGQRQPRIDQSAEAPAFANLCGADTTRTSLVRAASGFSALSCFETLCNTCWNRPGETLNLLILHSRRVACVNVNENWSLISLVSTLFVPHLRGGRPCKSCTCNRVSPSTCIFQNQYYPVPSGY